MSSTINFMGKRYLAFMLSAVLMIAAIVSLAINGLNLGLDFTGGSVIEMSFESAVQTNTIKTILQKNNYPKAVVQHFGSNTDIVIRLASSYNSATGDNISSLLKQSIKKPFTIERVEYIGPNIGKELREQGGLGLLVAFLVIILYLALRFQIKFSVGAIAALIHDVVITLGIFSLFSWEFDLTVLAAVLAIIGYSLNDSIVVSDRIRENFRLVRKNQDASYLINKSLNQILGRTIVTSFTTLLVVLALLIVGGSSLFGFSIAMTIGIVVGSYSSIYVVANLLLSLKLSKDNLVVSDAEKALIDSRP
jgi:preprotein translocase subunit SecF